MLLLRDALEMILPLFWMSFFAATPFAASRVAVLMGLREEVGLWVGTVVMFFLALTLFVLAWTHSGPALIAHAI